MLDQTLFDKELDRVYAAFNKSVPSSRVKGYIWDAVSDTDNLFFASACGELRLLSQLPNNLAAWFLGRWDDWRTSRRTAQEDERERCPQGCENGWFTLFDTRRPMAPYAFKCVCNADSRVAEQKAWTRAEIDGLPHLSWEDPFRTRAQREAWLAAKEAKQ